MKRLNLAIGVLLFTLVVSLVVACAPKSGGSSTTAPATKEPFKIGVTQAMTGPLGATYSPWAEGFRLYVQQINDKGGVNGHQIVADYQDDSGDGAKASANLKKFTDEGVNMIVNISISATYAASVAEAKRANTPILFVGMAPKESEPPSPERLVFTSSHGNTTATIVPLVYALKDIAPKVTKLGAVAVQIPVSMLMADMAAKTAKEQLGMDAIVKSVPMTTADMTPVASAFVDAKVDSVVYFGGTDLMTALYDALKKLGWSGPLLSQGDVEFVLERMKKDENLLLYNDVEPMTLNLPAHQEIIAAANKFGVKVNSGLAWGWVTGQTLETVLKRTTWPVSTDALVNTMNSLQLERHPLTYTLKWAPGDHVGPVTEGIYHWDQKQGKLAAREYWRGSSDGSQKPQKVNRID